MRRPKDYVLDRVAKAWYNEWELWIFRRRMDKQGYEMVRLDEPDVISNDQHVEGLPTKRDEAEREFEIRRTRAAAAAAIGAMKRRA